MKSLARFLLVVALLSALAACTPPDDAQNAAATPPAAPVIEQTVEPAAPTPAAPQLPAVAALDDAQRAEAVLAARECNLESVDGQSFSGTAITLATSSAVKATGWLKVERSGADVSDTTLRIESEDKSRVWAVPVQLAIAREDLASSATPGFDVAFDAGTLSSGRYHLYLTYRVDGVLYGCDNGRYVTQL